MNNPYQNMAGMNPNQLSPSQLEMMKNYNMMMKQSNPSGGSMVEQLFKGSSVAGPGGGTSLADLQKIPTTRQHAPMSPQQNPQYRQRSQPETRNDDENEVHEEHNKIKNLVTKINNSLDDFKPSKSQNTDDSEDESTEKDEDTKENDKSSYYIPDMLKEPVLIIIIYVILSQGFVRKSIGNYISYINPTQDGYVSLMGYVIYGSILALLFMFFKKILIK
jgi:hypothetical protein